MLAAKKRATDRLQREYGLTAEDWLRIHDHQDGVCPICKSPLAGLVGGGGKKAALDHRHKDGLIRGLLCKFPCNRVLGHLRDNADLFKACADYLTTPPASAAFGAPRYTLPGRVGTKKRTRLRRRTVRKNVKVSGRIKAAGRKAA